MEDMKGTKPGGAPSVLVSSASRTDAVAAGSDAAASRHRPFSALPSPSLPNGSGARRGIGERLSINPVIGIRTIRALARRISSPARLRSMPMALAAVLGLANLSGCGRLVEGELHRLTFSDSLDGGFSQPVAVGTAWTIYYQPTDDYDLSSNHTIESSDPEVLTVIDADTKDHSASVLAAKAGDAELQVRGTDGSLIDFATIQQDNIAGMRLIEYWEYALRSEENTREAASSFAVLQNMSVILNATMQNGAQAELRHQEMLTLRSSDPGLTVDVGSTDLRIIGVEPGSYAFELGATSWSGLRSYTTKVVTQGEVKTLQIEPIQSSAKEFTLVAHAYLADGTEVYGLACAWKNVGDGTLEASDSRTAFVSFEEEGDSSTVTVTTGALTATTTLEADVSSACSMSGNRLQPGSSLSISLGLALAMVLIRRRRGRTPAAGLWRVRCADEGDL